MKYLILLFSAIVFLSCSSNTDTEKYQVKRSNIINVKEKVQEIDFKDVFIGRASKLYIINNYLLILLFKNKFNKTYL